MNVLIVEDLDQKANAVEGLLREVCENSELCVVRAKSLATGRRELAKLQFDLLVLDLMLPMRDGGPPKEGSGADLLEEIVDGDTMLKPTHVICLTEYPDLADVIASVVLRSLVHVVKFDGIQNEWRVTLKAKILYIRNRVLAASASPQNFSTDLAIVTSSPMVELDEVLHLSDSFKGEFHRADALHYYLARWTRTNGTPMSVVACAAPQMGMTAACATAMKLIERWRPRFLVMVGIAAGTKKEFNFGDILVGEIVFDYGSGKIVEAKSGKRTFVPDPRPLILDVELKALLQRCEREQCHIPEIMHNWRGKSLNWTPKVRLGVIASGAAVVQSPSLVDDILKGSRKVVGLEMEAYGVCHAAALCKEPRPRVIIAKSVSDFADPGKSDDFQQLAAFTSAQFIREFFTGCSELSFD